MKFSKKQILLTGCYRSGTEYITLLLNNHPKLSSTMYIVNFMRNCYGRYDPINEERNYSKLVFETAERIRSRFKIKLNAHNVLDQCNETDHVTYGFLYDIIMYELVLKDTQKDCWAEKTQLVWTKIPDFLEQLPEGKVIHIVRNPLNVLASFKKYTYAPEPAYLGAIFNCYDSMKKGVEYQKNLDPSRYILLRYEDIIADPEKTLVKVFRFLDLSHDHNLLSEEGWRDSWGRPWTQNSMFASDNNQNNFDKSASLDRWKKNLLPWEIALCEAVNGDFLDIYGYPRPNSIIDWKQMLKPCLKDTKIREHFLKWLYHQEGIEEFPTDPLLEKNWEENNIKTK